MSTKKWPSLNPMEIDLEKRGALMVRYTLRLTADLPEGSYNCAASFSTLPAAEQVTGMGIWSAHLSQMTPLPVHRKSRESPRESVEARTESG
jgi:hypothetical protein